MSSADVAKSDKLLTLFAGKFDEEERVLCELKDLEQRLILDDVDKEAIPRLTCGDAELLLSTLNGSMDLHKLKARALESRTNLSDSEIGNRTTSSAAKEKLATQYSNWASKQVMRIKRAEDTAATFDTRKQLAGVISQFQLYDQLAGFTQRKDRTIAKSTTSGRRATVGSKSKKRSQDSSLVVDLLAHYNTSLGKEKNILKTLKALSNIASTVVCGADLELPQAIGDDDKSMSISTAPFCDLPLRWVEQLIRDKTNERADQINNTTHKLFAAINGMDHDMVKLKAAKAHIQNVGSIPQGSASSLEAVSDWTRGIEASQAQSTGFVRDCIHQISSFLGIDSPGIKLQDPTLALVLSLSNLSHVLKRIYNQIPADEGRTLQQDWKALTIDNECRDIMGLARGFVDDLVSSDILKTKVAASTSQTPLTMLDLYRDIAQCKAMPPRLKLFDERSDGGIDMGSVDEIDAITAKAIKEVKYNPSFGHAPSFDFDGFSRILLDMQSLITRTEPGLEYQPTTVEEAMKQLKFHKSLVDVSYNRFVETMASMFVYRRAISQALQMDPPTPGTLNAMLSAVDSDMLRCRATFSTILGLAEPEEKLKSDYLARALASLDESEASRSRAQKGISGWYDSVCTQYRDTFSRESLAKTKTPLLEATKVTSMEEDQNKATSLMEETATTDTDVVQRLVDELEGHAAFTARCDALMEEMGMPWQLGSWADHMDHQEMSRQSAGSESRTTRTPAIRVPSRNTGDKGIYQPPHARKGFTPIVASNSSV